MTVTIVNWTLDVIEISRRRSSEATPTRRPHMLPGIFGDSDNPWFSSWRNSQRTEDVQTVLDDVLFSDDTASDACNTISQSDGSQSDTCPPHSQPNSTQLPSSDPDTAGQHSGSALECHSNVWQVHRKHRGEELLLESESDSIISMDQDTPLVVGAIQVM